MYLLRTSSRVEEEAFLCLQNLRHISRLQMRILYDLTCRVVINNMDDVREACYLYAYEHMDL